MAKNLNLAVETFEAGSDLSAAQFQAVAYASDGQVDLAGAAATQVVGVLQDDAGSAAGRAVLVGPALAGGITKWKAGAAVTNGAFVTTDATGRCVIATAGQPIWGIAQSASGAADEIISVKFGYLGLAV